jgi:hypothetical protein
MIRVQHLRASRSNRLRAIAHSSRMDVSPQFVRVQGPRAAEWRGRWGARRAAGRAARIGTGNATRCRMTGSRIEPADLEPRAPARADTVAA